MTRLVDWNFPYRSQRMPVLAGQVVATSQPLAAQAGLQMLQRGGNAVDAALAAAAALVVVEPVMNGLGSDTQVQVWDGERLHGLNSSGRAPAAWTPARFAGRQAMPTEGWDSVTVPGTPAAWAALSQRFGRLPLHTVFEPAMRYAKAGFAVSPNIARLWASQEARLKQQPGFAEVFLPDGRPPRAGERFRIPQIAATLDRIAASAGEDFYAGAIAGQLVAHSRAHGGVLSAEDLAGHRVDWVEPLAARYRSLTVHELPPNTQGLAVQIALGILAHFDMGPSADPTQRIHLQVEAMKVAFADVYAHVAEPGAMRLSAQDMIDEDYLAERARGISLHKAAQYGARPVPGNGTIYLAAADEGGMMVSLIQSNFQGFGSGVVAPECGVSLNNRGSGFSLQPGHPNEVAGGKRPFHTILPAFLSRGGQPVAALGVVGANMQPQGQVQVISALEDLGLNPQAALDMPRWRIDDAGRLRLEAEFDAAVAEGLRARGHDVDVRPPRDLEFGGAQLVMCTPEGHVGASDPRRDGCAVGF